MVDLTNLAITLSAISSVAVIAGAGFVIVQLRQNAGILSSTLRQEKKQAAFEMLERLTDESFARRRGNFYQKINKYRQNNWEGFDDSADDFEIRNFAYLYELYGTMVKDHTIEFSLVADMLQYIAVNDWKEFAPAAEHYAKRYGPHVVWWRSFEWLASETEKYVSKRDGKVE